MSFIRTHLKRILPSGVWFAARSWYWSTRASASQLGQDVWVFGEVFNGRRGGTFVEIGSADGITFNNTLLLEKRYGWTGVCIEANPAFYETLCRVRSARCLNVCIDSTEGDAEFAPRALFGGIVGDDTDNRKRGDDDIGATIRVPTRTLVSVLREASAPKVIDYLSVDVEGAEDRILCTFAFDEYRFRCMTIERPSTKLRAILAQNGYILVKEIPHHDAFFVHTSHMEELEDHAFHFWGSVARRRWSK